MKIIFALFLLLAVLAFSSCSESKTSTERSVYITEDATIVGVTHTSSVRQDEFVPDNSGSFGLSMGGGFKVVPSSTSEIWTVTFRYKNGLCTVYSKDLYERMRGHEGEKVEMKYAEVYSTRRDAQTSASFKFIDANLK